MHEFISRGYFMIIFIFVISKDTRNFDMSLKMFARRKRSLLAAMIRNACPK